MPSFPKLPHLADIIRFSHKIFYFHSRQRQHGQRWLAIIVILSLLTACFPGSELLTPLTTLPFQYEVYQANHRSQYPISSRPPGTAKEVAEFFMRQYQPGPLPRIFEHSLLTDRHGRLLAELLDEGRRTWVSLDHISPYVIDAVIATEDASFYENNGIDSRRLVGALLQNIKGEGIVAGGSTITMQMARNLFFAPERRFDQSIDRKISEIFLAQDLSEHLSKDDILEIYLNLVFFGNRAYGIEAAAQTYFGKSAAQVNQAEATLLAGLPQSPIQHDPYVNFDDAKFRQRTVLNLLVKRGYIAANEADRIFGRQLNLKPLQPLSSIQSPHFVRFVEGELAEDLGVVPARAGLRVTTTLDLQMQEMAQKIVFDQVAALRGAFNLTNSALIALKPRHAEILVMVGSADFNNKAIAGQVNVTLSPRQPGSTVKAALYAAAFNDNLISPSTVLWDMPTRYTVAKIQTYIPVNYDRKFHGPVTVRTALANSYNVPAIKLIDQVGPDRMAQVGKAMGLTTWSDEPGKYNLPLTLGANEVSLLDLTNLYHTLANEGLYSPYRFVLDLTDGMGNHLDTYDEELWWQVISPQAAFQVTSILSDYEARKPAFGQNTPLNLAIFPAAAKTGTSTSFRDNWTIGYTKNLVVGVWAGNSNGRPMLGASGVTGAAPIWNKFMTAVLTDTAIVENTLGVPTHPFYWQFTPPPALVERPLECPKEIYCARKSEFYTYEWIEKTGRNGPTGDGIAMRDRVVPVRVRTSSATFIAGFCSTPQGDQRTLLTLPSGFGTLAPTAPSAKSLIDSLQLSPYLPVPSLSTWQFVPMPDTVNEKIVKERLDAIRWSGRLGTALHLGPCGSVSDVLIGLYGKSARAEIVWPDRTEQIRAFDAAQAAAKVTPTQTPTVVLSSTRTSGATPTPNATLTPVPTVTPTPEVTTTGSVTQTSTVVVSTTHTSGATPTPNATLTPVPTVTPTTEATTMDAATPTTDPGTTGNASTSIQYRLASSTQDNNCPGHYLLGMILNADGGPVPGVRVAAVDQWGNYAEGVSKWGASDFGQWNIPLDYRVRSFTVYVRGETGETISPAITISHQGDAGPKCHHLNWQRVE